MRSTGFQALWHTLLAAGLMGVIAWPAMAQPPGHVIKHFPGPPPTPVVLPTGGTYTGSVLVTITDTDSYATLKFTTDNSNPLTSTTAQAYTAAFTLTRPATVQAVATDSGYNSGILEVLYNVVPVTPTPTISPAVTPAPGTPIKIYTGPTTVSISAMPGAEIRFTTDGTNPVSSNTAQSYSGPFVLNPVYPQLWYGVISAAAQARDYVPSAVATSSFEVIPYGPAPLITPPTGTYPPGTAVTISGPAPNVVWITYTTDGSDPLKTPNWTAKIYSQPLIVSTNTTVRAAVTTWPSNAPNGGRLTSQEAQAVYAVSTNASTPVQIISATPGNGTVQLTFDSTFVGTITDPISTQYTYTVYAGPSGVGPFVSVAAAITLSPAPRLQPVNPPRLVGNPRVAAPAGSTAAPAPVAPSGSAVVAGLTNGQTYYFFITSRSAAGLTSAPSNLVSAAPVPPPLVAQTYLNHPGNPMPTNGLPLGNPTFRFAGINDFGNVKVGVTSSMHQFTIQNTGSVPIAVTSVFLGSIPPVDLTIVPGTDTCSATTIAPGLSCTVGVTFTPTVVGPLGEVMSLSSSTAGVDQSAIYSLFGFGVISLSPATYIFGPGMAPTATTFTLTNVENVPFVITGFGWMPAATPGFSFTGGTCVLDMTLNVGSSCTKFVTFTPSALTPSGTNALLVVTANGIGNGVGTTAPTSFSFSSGMGFN